MTGGAERVAGKPRGLFKRRLESRRGRWLRRLALLGFLAGVVLVAGFVDFTESARSFRHRQAVATDGIVVLTGGTGRVAAGFDLLRHASANRLLISGVHAEVGIGDLTPNGGGDVSCCVDLGYDADDTIGNAREAAGWAHGHGFRSLTIVTSSYHMPRALLEFRAALGGEIAIEPYPVDSETVHLDEWWRWPGTVRLLAREYGKYLLALARTEWETV
jgi:uncharacterized SAM-binding protein YcdF (DUF218 family)